MTTEAVSSTARRRRRALGFRARVLGLMAILLLGATALGLFLQQALLLDRLSNEVADSLEQERLEIERLARGSDPDTGQPFGTDVRAIFDTFLARNVPGEGEVYLTIVAGRPYRTTTAPDGVRLDRDVDLIASWSALQQGSRGSLDTDAGSVQYLAVPLADDGTTRGVFIVANFERQEQREIEEFIRVEAIVSAGVVLVALSAAWLLAGRLLRPVRELTDTATVITETDLSRRIPVETNDEIGRLADTFNDMLDRLDTAFATQRRFIDDAGHELRTPITVVRGHLEVMGDDPADREETIALVTDELDRMTRIVNDLLLLAKAEQPDFVRPEPVELADLTTELVARARALADRDWQLASCGEGEVALDAQRINQALLNLVRNAVEHTTAAQTVALGSSIVGDSVRFWVADSGSGVAAADRERIFERFDRGGSAGRHGDGAGLGLSIVKAIVDGHGGTVELTDTPGGGATFTITLPHRSESDSFAEDARPDGRGSERTAV
ncbi:MAG: HAMP domain-containing sensor histidine kinase [Actinomycetota bacterium]